MNSITRVTANIFFSIIISFVFANIAFYGFGFIKASPLNAAIVVFAACFASSLLICELFSISKETNKIKNKVKKSRLSKIAKRIAIENARNNRRLRNRDSQKSMTQTDMAENIIIQPETLVQTDQNCQLNQNSESPVQNTRKEFTNNELSAETKISQETPDPLKSTDSERKDSTVKTAVINAGKSDLQNEQASEKIVSLYIGNLSYTVQDSELRNLLKVYGNAEKISIMRNNKGKKKKAYAYIKMCKSAAEKAASELNNRQFQSRSIIVKVSYN